MERLRLGKRRWETAKFNNRLQLTEIGLGYSATNASLWKTTLEYGVVDVNGNVDVSKNSGNLAKQITSVSGMVNPIVQTYKYDSLDRILEAKETTNNQHSWSQNFGYDRYGNRTIFNQLIGQNQQTQTPTVDVNTNRFTTGQGFVYDFNGNLVQDADGKLFTFNGDNKQTQIKDANNNVIGTYFYDGNGARVKKITNTETTIFVYSGGKLIAEYSTQLATIPSISYLTNDHLGSPRVITDANGQVSSRRDFMPFGEELNSGIGGRNTTQKYNATNDEIRQKFTGYQKDQESGLDFAEARMYKNNLGRFTAVDPLLASGKSANPQSFNRYAYTLNNPVNLVDPSGLISANTGAKGKEKETEKECDFACRVGRGGILSKADLRLLQFHVANGTALGYSYLNAQETRQSQAENRRNSSLKTINEIIDRSVGVGSTTRSGKKVTKTVKGLVKRLKNDAADIYDTAFSNAINLPGIVLDDDKKQNISTTKLVRPDPDFEAELNAWSIGIEYGEKNFKAKNKTGNIGNYFYGRDNIEALAFKIFERAIEFGYSDGEIEGDLDLQEDQEFRERGKKLPLITE